MNSLKNKVQLIGNLGQNPEIVSFENGNKLAKLVVATNETYRNTKGEKITDTQWHNLIAWGKTAEIIEKYLTKGQEVAIEGKLVNDTYEAKDGSKRYTTKIQINELLMLGGKQIQSNK
jgi:single-strand DNA-binding protein